ncbi:hypothetical protein F5X98DRAFT_223859 [Xylaria grammica]|nr:hypothetical protein F5X98DRAFT_223859 [Xylaria grammica]
MLCSPLIRLDRPSFARLNVCLPPITALYLLLPTYLGRHLLNRAQLAHGVHVDVIIHLTFDSIIVLHQVLCIIKRKGAVDDNSIDHGANSDRVASAIAKRRQRNARSHLGAAQAFNV